MQAIGRNRQQEVPVSDSDDPSTDRWGSRRRRSGVLDGAAGHYRSRATVGVGLGRTVMH
ncbi:hypothetical protein GFS60_05134 [Rhodococcus sp. WAY2]|nr:hypothetical protein GFS60_05134 [Rhodococcus sp. WAY2]